MGCYNIIRAVLVMVIVYQIYYVYQTMTYIPPLPNLPKGQWWGPGNPPKTMDTSIRPFKVQFKPEKIFLLKERLNETTWLTEPLVGIGFQYGFNTKYLKEVADFWRTKYDFAEREKKLNSLPQFKTNIQGLDIHFVLVTQPNPNKLRVVPLLLLHGWPGSFVEFYKMIFELSSEENKAHDFVFSIVVPSLPGYGYSQGSSKPGLGAAHMSVIMANLMERLGYSKYVIQGGDWGSFVGAVISMFHPERVIGYHTNMPFAKGVSSALKHLFYSFYPTMFIEEKHVTKMYPVGSFYSYLLEEFGYSHLQATKPDTIGVALRDSPLGLAAYILEKFSTWTNREWKSLPDGGLTKMFDLSELLDNIMIYWDSGSITTSMRLYSETFNKVHTGFQFDMIPIHVPTAVLKCSNEVVFASKYQVLPNYANLVRYTEVDDVGHFAAFQDPKMMAKDILDSLVVFEKYHANKSTKPEL